jgi:ribosomal protein S18 acetylase RimI-like enzyme
MLSVRAEDPETPDALALIDELSVALARITGDSGRSSFDADDVRVAGALFVVARNVNGEAVGCGAFRPMAEGVAEIKRMYSRPGNPGVGSAILAFLELQAAALGYSTVWLSTRAINQRALEFYRARGYTPIRNYGKYAGNPESACFGKHLDR